MQDPTHGFLKTADVTQILCGNTIITMVTENTQHGYLTLDNLLRVGSGSTEERYALHPTQQILICGQIRLLEKFMN